MGREAGGKLGALPPGLDPKILTSCVTFHRELLSREASSLLWGDERMEAEMQGCTDK